MLSVNTKNPGVYWPSSNLSVSHARAHTHTHMCARRYYESCYREENENEREEKRKKEGGEKPMWQREILIFTESADPSCLPPSLSLSLLLQHHPANKPVLCLLLSTPTFISFRASSFLFLSPPPYTPLILPSYSLHFHSLSLSAFTLLYYHSFCIPPPSSSLTVGELQADRSSIH